MAPPLPPPLIEELEEEVLLRFPPHEPALLVRAALVCKRWCRLVSAPAFRRRFREFHRTPPMLGFLCNIVEDTRMASFVTTAAFCSPSADLGPCHTLDARHGRVLLHSPRIGSSEDVLVVWDPITDDKLKLPLLPRLTRVSTAAVLCSAAGACDHLDCHRGPLLEFFLCHGSGEWFICTYSSDAGKWSDPIATEQQLPQDYVNMMPSVLVGHALYFEFVVAKVLLKYDLESHQISVIGLPFPYYLWRHSVLEDGLGLAAVHESKLCIWRKPGPEADAGWAQNRVIELQTLLPSGAIFTSTFVVGFADAMGVIFLRAGLAFFTIDLKTYKVKKVCRGRNIYSVVPYMSFYTPALGAACTDEGPSVCASGA